MVMDIPLIKHLSSAQRARWIVRDDKWQTCLKIKRIITSVCYQDYCIRNPGIKDIFQISQSARSFSEMLHLCACEKHLISFLGDMCYCSHFSLVPSEANFPFLNQTRLPRLKSAVPIMYLLKNRTSRSDKWSKMWTRAVVSPAQSWQQGWQSLTWSIDVHVKRHNVSGKS